MYRFKWLKMLVVVLCLAAVIPALAAAALVAGNDYNQGVLDPVKFFVVDDSTPADGSVLLSAFNINLGNFSLQYKIGTGDWINYTEPFSISGMGNNGHKTIYMQLDGPTYDQDANLKFIGFEKTAYGLDLFSGLLVQWNDAYSLTLNMAIGGNDNVAPVPIPGAAFLLGSGLLCLVGYKRKTS